MCYAIVEVTYRATTSSNETIKVNDEAALEQRLATLQNNEQVERIRIFTQSKTLTRTTTWSESWFTRPIRMENMKCVRPKSLPPSAT